MRILIVSLCMLWLFVHLNGQTINKRTCGVEKYYNDRPLEKYKRDFLFNENLKTHISNTSKRIKTTYQIPIVVHVIHNNGAENISQAQIESQIDVLNEDFRRLNSDAAYTPASFTSVAADMEIEFFLAQKDPNGNCHDGINRSISSTYSDLDQTSEDAGLKALIQWDPAMYLNIWIVKSIDNGNTAGYAYFPGGSAALDGLVIAHDFFGKLGTVGSPYNLGRTATHEIGHYFGLHHVWGQNAGGCSDDDGFSDTPNQDQENYYCPTHPSVSCSNSGDMYMNYMDYTNDNCMNLFTLEQKSFVHNHLINTVRRNSLHTSTNLLATGYSGCSNSNSSPSAEFTTSNTSISTGSSINFTDLSGNTPNSWSWSFPGATSISSTLQNPTGITYNTSGTYDVSLIASNTYGSDTIIKTNYINVGTSSSSPAADFTSSIANPQIYQSVTYTDISTNSPTSWNWSITPSTYSLINSSSLTDQNIDIEFTAVGTYQVTLDVANNLGSDSKTQYMYVSNASCDSIFHYYFPSYYIDNNNSSGFLTYEYDEDQNMPPNYLSSITISDIPADYWVPGEGNPDLYFILEDASSTIWTSPTIDGTNPPVAWNISHLLQPETYSVKVYDEDVLADDYLGTATFYGLNYSGSAYDYTNSNGTLQVDYITTRFGVTSSWMDFDETINGVTNHFTGVTADFNPDGQADDWLTFGPITIPSNGAEIKWKHMFGDNAKRNAYQIMVNTFGPMPSNFSFGGDTILSFSENDPNTSGHTTWTDQIAFLDGAIYGNTDIYIGFNHNANNMDMLFLDDIQLSSCLVTDIVSNEIENNLKIYPNPFNQELNILFDAKDEATQFILYNALGQEVRRLSSFIGQSHIKISTADLSEGLYVLEINMQNELIRSKLILQNQ